MNLPNGFEKRKGVFLDLLIVVILALPFLLAWRGSSLLASSAAGLFYIAIASLAPIKKMIAAQKGAYDDLWPLYTKRWKIIGAAIAAFFLVLPLMGSQSSEIIRSFIFGVEIEIALAIFMLRIRNFLNEKT
jgi:hypothetical protein